MTNANHNTNHDPATLPNGDPHLRVIGTFNETQDTDVSSASYTPSDDDLRHLIHAMLLDRSYERFDRVDYEHARCVSLQARSINTDDEEWIRAQIAVCRADGLDPWTIHLRELEKNPTLDQHAVDRRHWPEPFCPYFEDAPEGFEDHPAHDLFLALGLASNRAVDHNPVYNDDELMEEYSNEQNRRLIRIVTSLYGQEGFEAILWIPWVQETLLSAQPEDFGRGGIFPNLTFDFSNRRRPEPGDMNYYPVQRNWSKKVVRHLGDEELNNVLLSDLRKYTMDRSWRTFERGDFPSDFDGLDWRSDHRGKEPRFWKYVAAGMGHWLINFNLRLAMLAEPGRPWRIITSQKHSSVWDGEHTLFDLNFLALGVPPDECFEMAYETELPVGRYRLTSRPVDCRSSASLAS